MSELVKCISCSRALSLPTTKESAAGWNRHSKGSGNTLKFAYTCGKCDHRKPLARWARR